MKLLIDECIDERLRLAFSEYECETARFAGFAGLKNGQLLDAAEIAGFDVILTVDRSMVNQQNLAGASCRSLFSVLRQTGCETSCPLYLR